MTERNHNSPEQERDRAQILLRYNGVESSNMELNEVVADKFISVADIRSTVIILDKQQDRALDYDELSEVKVGKMVSVKHPGKDRGQYSSGRDKDMWFISIDSQSLARQVTDTITNRHEFSSAYTSAFNGLVVEGLEQLLVNEKLLNGEHYTLEFLLNHIITDLEIIQISIYGYVIASLPPDKAAVAISLLAAATGLKNVGFNYMTYRSGQHHEWWSSRGEEESRPWILQHLRKNDPFVRRQFKEFVLPPVPLDRLFRGYLYLKKHGSKFIQTASTYHETGS